jgi:hypothetical protein
MLLRNFMNDFKTVQFALVCWYHFCLYAPSRNCERQLLTWTCLSVHPSVRPSVRPSFHLSVCLSVRIVHLSPHTRIFMKFCIWLFSGNLPGKFKFNWNLKILVGTLHKDVRTFMITSRRTLPTIEMFQRIFVENVKPHILFTVIVPYVR